MFVIGQPQAFEAERHAKRHSLHAGPVVVRNVGSLLSGHRARSRTHEHTRDHDQQRRYSKHQHHELSDLHWGWSG